MKEINEMTDREYLDFMWNPKNEYNCDGCPENRHHDGNGFDHRLPCEQQNCWVTRHCERR